MTCWLCYIDSRFFLINFQSLCISSKNADKQHKIGIQIPRIFTMTCTRSAPHQNQSGGLDVDPHRCTANKDKGLKLNGWRGTLFSNAIVNCQNKSSWTIILTFWINLFLFDNIKPNSFSTVKSYEATPNRGK